METNYYRVESPWEKRTSPVEKASHLDTSGDKALALTLKRKLHDSKLPWQPQAGNYVYDIKGIIEKSSPFQEKVFFILDIKHFLKRARSMNGIKESMCWLPLWEDCRNILKELDVSWSRIESQLVKNSAFENNTERQVLYEIILDEIENKQFFK